LKYSKIYVKIIFSDLLKSNILFRKEKTKMTKFMFLLSGTGTEGGGFTMLIMLGVMFVFLYFFMIRPQRKQQKEEQEMRSGLAVGDEVTTIGGIIGKVVSIKEETFVLETTKDKTKIRFLKAAVRNIDVKAADIAASVLETQTVPATEEPVVEQEVVEDAPEAEVQE
jgi:preprotein translocase subunit YajC